MENKTIEEQIKDIWNLMTSSKVEDIEDRKIYLQKRKEFFELITNLLQASNKQYLLDFLNYFDEEYSHEEFNLQARVTVRHAVLKFSNKALAYGGLGKPIRQTELEKFVDLLVTELGTEPNGHNEITDKVESLFEQFKKESV